VTFPTQKSLNLDPNPRYVCQNKKRSNPALMENFAHGEEEDSDRRRKVSLPNPCGSACSKEVRGNLIQNYAPTTKQGACDVISGNSSKSGALQNTNGNGDVMECCPNMEGHACLHVSPNEDHVRLGGTPNNIMRVLENSNAPLTSRGTRVPPCLQNSNFVLGSKNDVLGLGNILYTSQEHGNHVGNQQLANTPITSGTNDLVSSFIPGTTKQAEEILDMQDVKEAHSMVPVQSTFSDTVMRQHIVLSSVSSPDTGKVLQPVFFSRDAKEKRKPGRPKKKPRGRPKGKGTLTLVDASEVMRELFKDAELRNSLRKSTDRCEVVIPIPDPEGPQV
jgi:hypothetical protein